MNRKPFDLATLPRCGAQTRAGTPCQRAGNLLNGRCKLHGGRSTGPLTPAGRQACGKPHVKHGDYKYIRRTREVRWILRMSGQFMAVLWGHPDAHVNRRARAWLEKNLNAEGLERLSEESVQSTLERLFC
jgi:hypothetical protein